MNHKYQLEINHFIDYSHQLPDTPDLVTKKCCNLHGHTGLVKVFISEDKLKKGMVVDFKKVKEIINQFDHIHLGYRNSGIVEFNEDFPPTAENIAKLISKKIYEEIGLIAEVWFCEGYKGNENSCWAKYNGDLWD